MVLRMTVPATKSDNLRSILVTQIVEREPAPINCPLTMPPYTCRGTTHVCTHAHMHAHAQMSIFNFLIFKSV